MRSLSFRTTSTRAALAICATALVQGCDARAPTGAVTVAPIVANAKVGAWEFGPWGDPVNLGAPVNSDSGENRPFISAGGDQLFFTSAQATGSQGMNDLWVARRSDEAQPWGVPVNLGPVVNSTGNDLAAFLSADDKELYFARAGSCGTADLWVARRHNKHQDTGWDTAEDLGCEINSGGTDADPFLVEDGAEQGTLYFVSNRNPVTGFDVYKSVYDKRAGTYGAAVAVAELNSAGVEFKVVIRGDGLEAFIGSNRPGSADNDIWVSTRARQTDAWGTPKNLGPGINSTAKDSPGSLSADGTTLYFQSNRAGGLGLGDIWMVKRTRSQ